MKNIFGGLPGLGLLIPTRDRASVFDYLPPIQQVRTYFPELQTPVSAIETPAVRKAKAAFTAPGTTAPWQKSKVTKPDGQELTRTLAMKSIVDHNADTDAAGNRDVQNSFTVYKALDRLQTLADAAAKTSSSTKRATLQKSFDKGLAELETFMQTARGDKLNLGFDNVSRIVKSSTISAGATRKVAATPIATSGTGPIAGLDGTMKIAVHLAKNGHSEDLVVDLSTLAQPPTLDAIATALNTAIGATLLRDANGVPINYKDGQPISRYQTRFTAQRINAEDWGLGYELPASERVMVRQAAAPDALMIVNGQSFAVGHDTSATSQPAIALRRQENPSGTMTAPTRLTTLSATDRLATARAALLQKAVAGTRKLPKVVTLPVTDPTVHAGIDVRAATGDGAGNSYIVGTTKGDFGGVVSEGGRDLYLTKVDSRGAVIWQRSLGVTGDADGAAVAVDAAGAVTIAGNARARVPKRNPDDKETRFDDTSDQDIIVARFSAEGDTLMSNVVSAVGDDACTALTIGANGEVFVGGRNAAPNTAYLLRLDTTGRMVERRDMIGVDSVSALALGKDGNVVALTRTGGGSSVSQIAAAAINTDLATLALGAVDARALAVAADGSIAVAGTTDAQASGAQVNTVAGGRDGFVARIDAALRGATTTYVGTGGDDQIDSVAFMGGNVYVGGRTDGALKSAARGPVDGFVARIDAATGAIGDTNQFGRGQATTGAVRIVTLAGGGGSLQALGLPNGELAPVGSQKLTATTGLNAGDGFAVSVDGKRPIVFTIEADDTLETLTRRLSLRLRGAATVSTATAKDGRQLSIGALAGHSVTLAAGPKGSDALAKLGLSPRLLQASASGGGPASLVTPGGNYALDLPRALSIDTKAGAQFTLGKLKSAIATTQSAYRSLYWDDTKAAVLNGGRGVVRDSYTASRTAAYKAALARLSS